MAQSQVYKLDDAVVFRGKEMRVAGRMLLEGTSGQSTFRYLLSDGAGAPVLLEQAAASRFALLRPFPPAAQPQTAGKTVTVGEERYTLVGVRQLKILETRGQAPAAVPRTKLLVSGMFEGPMGTLMRELAPSSEAQVYYFIKPLATGDFISAAAHSAARAARSRAAGSLEEDDD